MLNITISQRVSDTLSVPTTTTIISSTVTKDTSPSQYQRLPNELILQILYDALGLGNPRPITYKRFTSHIARGGRLARFLMLNRTLHALVLEAFYKRNVFICNERLDPYHHQCPTYGLYLPPPPARHLLRRLEITVETACWYFDAGEVRENSVRRLRGDSSAKKWSELARRVDCVAALKRAPGWKTLCELSDKEEGFSRLSELKVKIGFQEISMAGLDLRSGIGYDRAFWDVVEQAGITIKAPRVLIKTRERKLEKLVTVEAGVLEWVYE